MLSVAGKEGDISFYIDHRDPRKGSISDNGKKFAVKKRMQEPRNERERRKRDAAMAKMLARAESMTSVQTQTVMKMTQRWKPVTTGMMRCRIPGTRGTGTWRRRRSPSAFPATF